MNRQRPRLAQLENLESRLALAYTWTANLPVSLPDFQQPTSADLADLDGDGDLDAIAVSTSDGIGWFPNLDGRGEFGSRRTVETGNFSMPRRVRVVDVDSDGDLDISWIGGQSASRPEIQFFFWQANDGQGNFDVPAEGVTFEAPKIQWVDLDGDKDLDVLGTEYWLQNRDGRLRRVSFEPDDLTVTESDAADYDNDGDVDLVFSGVNADGSTVIRRLENVDGQWAARETFEIGTTVTDLDHVDVDSDGKLDVVFMATGQNSGRIGWLQMSDDGLMPPAVIQNAGGRGHLTIADIDGDQLDDVLLATTSPGGTRDAVEWLRNVPGGTLGAAQLITLETTVPEDVVSGDINLDGRPDVLLTTPGLRQVSWFENATESDAWRRTFVSDPGPFRASVLAGIDYDLDGREDVLSSSSQHGELYWHRQLEDGSFGKPTIVARNVGKLSRIYVADLDGDQDRDFIVASADQSRLSWFERTDSGWLHHEIARLFNLIDFDLGDLDGDGDLDLATTGSELLWFENQGGTFHQQLSLARKDAASMVRIADFDGDGDQDLVHIEVTNVRFLLVEVFENEGDSFVAQDVLDRRIVGTVADFAVGNIDSQGDLDFAYLEHSGGSARSRTSVGRFLNRFRLEERLPRSLQAFDLDVNGVSDFVIGTDEDIISIAIPTGIGEQTEVAIQNLPSPYSRVVASADLNGDGIRDLISADPDAGIVWHRLEGLENNLNDQANANEVELNTCHHPQQDPRFEKQPVIGDINGDRVFDSSDLVEVFRHGEYEDRHDGNSTWSTGDWNCDLEFDSRDVVLAFREGSYEPTELSHLNVSTPPDLAMRADDGFDRKRRLTSEIHREEIHPQGEAVELQSWSQSVDLLFEFASGDDDSLEDSSTRDHDDLAFCEPITGLAKESH